MVAAGDLLGRFDVRVLVLTGPVGVGKTRLAVAVAPGLADAFGGDVRFVPLAAVRDPDLVAGTIAGALAVPEVDGRSPSERLGHALRDRHMLLVLDNFEHLVPAGPLLPDLLRAAPALKLLVTSRAVLKIEGEHVLPVPPLASPDPARPVSVESLIEAPAARLFVARARSDLALTDANAPAIAELCRRLDGLPLAIELAATRGVGLSPKALLALLEPRLPLLADGPRSQPDRLQTMRNAIAWSYDILVPEEQALFRRLAVFAGGFTLEAAGAVTADDPRLDRTTRATDPLTGVTADEPSALPEAATRGVRDGIVSLVNQSLLQEFAGGFNEGAGGPRFGMLETIREYGLERLTEAGELDDARRAHASHYLALAVGAQWNPDHKWWMDRLATELDNLRAALAWGLAGDEASVDAALRLATALWLFWQTRGHAAEGRRWLRLALATGYGEFLVRGKACAVAGMLA